MSEVKKDKWIITWKMPMWLFVSINILAAIGFAMSIAIATYFLTQ